MTVAPAFQSLARNAATARPAAAIVLGSGMGPVARQAKLIESVPFVEVPGLLAPSVPGHAGSLKLVEWAGKRVLIFEGRLHYYEGHPWRQIVTPVQTAAFLGARVLLLTNAAGGIADQLVPGSLLSIRDHIEWTRAASWRQPGPGAIGPPRPSPYSPRLRTLLQMAAHQGNISLTEGIYAAVTGPCYETPAEIRALQVWGAAAVGMSTAREIQVGCDLGMECAAVSLITNRAAGLSTGPIHHEEVIAAALAGADRLAALLEGFLRQLD